MLLMHHFILFLLNKHQMTLNVTFVTFLPVCRMGWKYTWVLNTKNIRSLKFCQGNQQNLQLSVLPVWNYLYLSITCGTMCMGMVALKNNQIVWVSTVKCHICKHPENSCYAMQDHVRKEHNRTAQILSRESGKNHCVFVGDDEVFCNSMCTGNRGKYIVSLQACWKTSGFMQ